EHQFDCQPCAPRRKSYRRRAVDGRSQRKTPGNTKESSAGAVTRGGTLESGQPGARIFLERDARGGACAGSKTSIPRGSRTKRLCRCFCRDLRRAPRCTPRRAGCGDDAAAKRNNQLRDTEATAEHVSGERVGSSWWSDVLRREPSFYVSARRIFRGQDFQRRQAC